MCGANEFGQLGQGNTEPSFSPKRIRWREDSGDPMVSLSLSPSHSVALTSKGQISKKNFFIILVIYLLILLMVIRCGRGEEIMKDN